MNTLKTFAITIIAVTLGTQNPSAALVNKPVSHQNLVFVAPKQSDLIFVIPLNAPQRNKLWVKSPNSHLLGTKAKERNS
ncbi:MAG: hypothetical protein KME49_21435 [Brasilonema octagenarum HA4186-MV1]|jgi:hypothetical protein|uniref:Uncharacterized protein n=2 Tax=Brasilonema TaxID=383614 RepID=A0A856MI27_9CYAN|nr:MULTISPECIES: hypothetical protein [Brasilonema]MBW4628001.1 hypothetical protein [Brasilonema octagenarum HA4186-MV1]NMF62174.1 hypothetical protein [Brasilonema octagenarum UFV-OR1]QDL08787.1 hypothetical protein DP114_13585 [Brasilonema sennae CENA114]QDL15145.1 hypothetical protein DP113_13530 [Brasilonema octagenarum UFV-E1]